MSQMFRVLGSNVFTMNEKICTFSHGFEPRDRKQSPAVNDEKRWGFLSASLRRLTTTRSVCFKMRHKLITCSAVSRKYAVMLHKRKKKNYLRGLDGGIARQLPPNIACEVTPNTSTKRMAKEDE